MPLQLGGAETDRPHLITWDPAIVKEVNDALAHQQRLEAQGYRTTRQREGEVVLEPPPRGPNIGCFRILSQNGDDRLVWDRTIPKQVKDAFRKFKELIQKGYTAYATRRDGSKGHKITDFDPGLQEILFVPSTVPG